MLLHQRWTNQVQFVDKWILYSLFLQGKNRAVKIDIIHSSILNTVLIMTNDDLLLIILDQVKSTFRQDKIGTYSYNLKGFYFLSLYSFLSLQWLLIDGLLNAVMVLRFYFSLELLCGKRGKKGFPTLCSNNNVWWWNVQSTSIQPGL